MQPRCFFYSVNAMMSTILAPPMENLVQVVHPFRFKVFPEESGRAAQGDPLSPVFGHRQDQVIVPVHPADDGPGRPPVREIPFCGQDILISAEHGAADIERPGLKGIRRQHVAVVRVHIHLQSVPVQRQPIIGHALQIAEHLPVGHRQGTQRGIVIVLVFARIVLRDPGIQRADKAAAVDGQRRPFDLFDDLGRRFHVFVPVRSCFPDLPVRFLHPYPGQVADLLVEEKPVHRKLQRRGIVGPGDPADLLRFRVVE